MNKPFILLIIFGVFLFNYLNGQNFKQRFNDFFSKKDTMGQRILLEEWEKSDSNDAELYVAYYNYYVNKSKNDFLTFGQNPQGDNVLEIKSTDSSVENQTIFLYSNNDYNIVLLNKGFEWIEKGIEKHPNRLDMRFGKIYMYGQIHDYENFTEEIIKAIDYSKIITNKWTWEDNKPLEEDPEEFLLSSIQTYQLQLYDTENDSLLDNMKRIAEAVLKYYPKHVQSLTNISIVLMIQKKYDLALEYLLKAEKIDSKDLIVLNNIAQAYKLKGDKKKSIKYYKKTIKYGDKDDKEYAKDQIGKLKNE